MFSFFFLKLLVHVNTGTIFAETILGIARAFTITSNAMMDLFLVFLLKTFDLCVHNYVLTIYVQDQK